MFGVDLGINISSIICIGDSLKLINHVILSGDRVGTDKKTIPKWNRIMDMGEALAENIFEMERQLIRDRKAVARDVSIEEPIYSQRTFNPSAPIILAELYAILRYKLTRKGYNVYSINPVSAKTTAKKAFRVKHQKGWMDKRGKLTKSGMIAAFKYVTGVDPPHHTKYGKETLADSFFIAKTGLDRKRAGLL